MGKHVKLRKAGANLLGLCPFHGEKTPSFTVSPAKQFYHCFGCGAHGSAIGFLMEFSGLSYVEAIEDLAQSMGLQVPREASRPGDRPTIPAGGAARLIDMLGTAARFYQQKLREAPRAIDYLKKRGLRGVTAKAFGLGYAPPGWRNLEAGVPDYQDSALVEAGLVQDGARDDRPGGPAGVDTAPAPAAVGEAGNPQRRKRYDRFRDRIMFPIRNARGGVIGFGARVIDQGEPKYLNSPETPVFSKGLELYGIYESRLGLRARNQAIIVEGYMDVVMLAEHGIDNAVATLGTATTPDHVRKLLRLVDHLVFGFDGDAAGRKAAWRALNACLPMIGDTHRVDFLFFPDGADPDSFVREHGEAVLRERITQAMPLSTFLLTELSAHTDLATPEGRAKFLAEARPLLVAIKAEGLRLQMAHAIADKAGIGQLELTRYLAATEPPPGRGRASGPAPGPDRPAARPTTSRRPGPRRPRRRGSPATAAFAAARRAGGAAAASGPPAAPRLRVRGAGPSLERRLRLLALCHPQLCREDAGRLQALDLLQPPLARWFEALVPLAEVGSVQARLDALAGGDHPDLQQVIGDLAADWGGVPSLTLEEARQEFVGALTQFERRALRDAAAQLVAGGLADDESRQLHRDLLASRRET
ncbi:MAG: DNA primase [Burkholderiaceae bacterium]